MAGSLVDPSYELVDPCPDIHALFLQFNARFFEGSLACCEVKWSPRMYSCAGVCSYEVRGGLCSIRLSKPLLTLRPRKDLVETLLHEMIHAYLFVKERNRDRDGHGPQFQFHMRRINVAAGTNITIYHSFHDEVAVFKTHWWRCAGPCKDRRPFFGYVKRSSNRAPGPNDLWWDRHQITCGGEFIKIKEPKGYGQKTKKKEEKAIVIPQKNTLDGYLIKPDANKKAGDVRFTGTGQKLGGSKSGDKGSRKRGLPIPFSGVGQKLGSSATTTSLTSVTHVAKPKAIEVIVLDDDDFDSTVRPPRTAGAGRLRRFDSTDSLELSFVADQKDTVICPSCNENVPEDLVNAHMDHCLA